MLTQRLFAAEWTPVFPIRHVIANADGRDCLTNFFEKKIPPLKTLALN